MGRRGESEVGSLSRSVKEEIFSSQSIIITEGLSAVAAAVFADLHICILEMLTVINN